MNVRLHRTGGTTSYATASSHQTNAWPAGDRPPEEVLVLSGEELGPERLRVSREHAAV